MKVNVFDIQGKVTNKIDLPKVFNEKFRPDLIRRAFLSFQNQKRQPYGPDIEAGLKTSAHYHGRRRIRFSMAMRDMARLPRLHTGSPSISYRVRKVPQAVKGRKAHPPKVEKDWNQKINKKENMLALRSAISATANMDIVKNRGHDFEKIKELPIVVKDDIESIKKTSDVKKFFNVLGLDAELARVNKRKVRSGKGKMRGRKYKKKIGPLIIIAKDDGIVKACKNLPGVNVSDVMNVTVEDLAPGALPGRLTIFSTTAIEKLKS